MSIATLGACPGKKGLPGGGGSLPGGGDTSKLPGGGNLPNTGNPDKVEPDGCGNYPSMGDVGRKLHAFLSATATLEKTTSDTVAVVKESCVIMGKELGMGEADLGGNAKEVCAKVYGVINDNMKVAVKAKTAFKVTIVPAVCKVDVSVAARASAECEANASAKVEAKCSGKCGGKCEGTCKGKMGTGGNAGQCDGVCEGSCSGSCEGHADVNASAQCKASAEVKANAEVTCTEPSVTATLDAKLVVDKTKAEATLKAMKAGFPKIFAVKARLEPLGAATASWVKAAGELASSGASFANAFKDQALCITAQLTAVAKASTQIQANVSVSVEVSASASASAGG